MFRARLIPTLLSALLWVIPPAVALAMPGDSATADWLRSLAAFLALLIAPGMQIIRLLEGRGLRIHDSAKPGPLPASWKHLARARRAGRREPHLSPWQRAFVDGDAIERSICLIAVAFVFSLTLSAAAAGLSMAAGLPLHFAVVLSGLACIFMTLLPSPSGSDHGPNSRVPRERPDATTPDSEKKPPPYIAFFQAETGKRRTLQQKAGIVGPSGTAKRRRTVLAFAAFTGLLALMSLGAENIARDRMWYMAYINSLTQSASPSWAEPFFGSGRVVPRFAANTWIAALAAWTTFAQAPADFIFEHAAPLLLIPLSGAAYLSLARSVFGHGRAALPAACALLVAALSAYPFFGSEPGGLFTRIAEDKSGGLLIILPLVLSLLIQSLGGEVAADSAENDTRQTATATGKSFPRNPGLTACALALAALASTHAIVYLLALAVFACMAPALMLSAERVRPARVFALAVLMAILALPPAYLGLQARRSIVPAADSPSVMSDQSRHPVLRSHLRMDRLMELESGGPIVNPRLLADPVIMLALAALPIAFGNRRKRWGLFLLCSSLPALGLAFTPYVSPAFGRLITPWMSYRALWALPVGFLLAVLLRETPAIISSHPLSRKAAAGVLVILLATSAFNRVPLNRLPPWGPEKAAYTIDQDGDLSALLQHLRTLPENSVIAAASGLAELVPAYSARHILAFSDRGTAVFAESAAMAQRRLRANTLLLNPLPAAADHDKAANYAAAAFGISHIVYEADRCPLGTRTGIGRFSLCELDAEPAGQSPAIAAPGLPSGLSAKQRSRFDPGRSFGIDHLAAHPVSASAAALVAAPGKGLDCNVDASAYALDGMLSRRRAGRWSGRPLTLSCSAGFKPEVGNDAAFLYVEANLPRAQESMLLTLRILDAGGIVVIRRYWIDFQESAGASIDLTSGSALPLQKIEFDLSPAYLPYINLRRLEVRAIS